MKKIIYFIIFFIFIFWINVCFYFISDDYRFFLKKIKNTDEVVYLDEKNINDDYVEPFLESAIFKNDTIENNIIENNLEENELIESEWEELVWSNVTNENSTKEVKVVLWKKYREILDLFSFYGLEKIEINTNLFDIISEYPDYYYEYYSNNLTIYMFVSKTYTEIFDIFNFLEEEQPFTLNEVNNFWTNSFYINLKEDINDSFVRIIVNSNGIVFWLKIKKDEYNNVRQKLLEFEGI